MIEFDIAMLVPWLISTHLVLRSVHEMVKIYKTATAKPVK